MNNYPTRICASIVTYFPNFDNFRKLIAQLNPQVDGIVIMNNSAEVDAQLQELMAQYPEQTFKLITPAKNLGVTAHNLGLAWIKEQGYDYVLFFDQDSCPASDMVSALLKTDHNLRQAKQPVAAVGAKAVDARSGESGGFLKFVGFTKQRCACDEGIEWCATDSLMLSGMLVKMETFDIVGRFDEVLFMDNIDTEWGLRAKSKGLRSFGVCTATLQHRVGDHVVEFLGRLYYIHNPKRQYYIFRNRLNLYKRSYIPIAWKINDFFHVCFKIVFHTLAVPPRMQYLKQIFLGIKDGMFDIIRSDKKVGT